MGIRRRSGRSPSPFPGRSPRPRCARSPLGFQTRFTHTGKFPANSGFQSDLVDIQVRICRRSRRKLDDYDARRYLGKLILRQVVAGAVAPELLGAGVFPADVEARGQKYLAAAKSVGAYSDSQGLRPAVSEPSPRFRRHDGISLHFRKSVFGNYVKLLKL